MGPKSKDIIGIDLGSYQTKIFKTCKNPLGNKWAIHPVPNGLIENNRIISKELFTQHIKEMLQNGNIESKKCCLCLPSCHIITKVILLPTMDRQALVENILYDMGEYLPLDIEHYIIDYKILKTSFTGNVEFLHIMTVAVLKEIISSYIDIIEKAGLKPLYIDIPSNCLDKILRKILPPNKQMVFKHENYCFVDIGGYSTNIFIFHKGNYFVDKTIVLGSAGIQQLIDEIKGVIRYFKNQIPQDNGIEKIILFGGGSMLNNLPLHIESQLNMEVTLLGDWVSLDLPIIKGMNQEEIACLWNAAGSTIREIES